jgi:hypothetical protein
MVQGKMNRRDNNFPLDRLWRTPPQLPHSFLQVLASKRKQQSGRLMGYKYQPDMPLAYSANWCRNSQLE